MKNILIFMFFTPFWCWSQSPGGVSANLKMWVKANTGITTSGSNVTGWTDQAAINTFSVTGTPQLVTSGLNYNPTVQFNGTSRFSGNTTINTTTQAFAIGKIVNNSGVSGSGALIGNTAVSSGDYFFHTEGGRLYSGNTGTYTGYNTTNTLPFNLYSEDLSKTPAASDIIRINGASSANNHGGDPVPFNRVPTLGSRATENIISGSELAEAISYDASQSAANTAKIESYLAIKYGITLNNTAGGTAGDYTTSAGTLIWDADNNSTYHRDIMAVGRDDNSGLLQKQSHQSDDSSRIYIGTLQATNAANSGSFSSDAQFLVAGHNGLALKHTSGNTEYPTGQGIFSRITREWKITNTNFSSTFSFDIKPATGTITASHLRILVDDDGNFSNATMYNPTITFTSGVISISGISTTMIPANSTRYLTVVSLSSLTPLPVTFISFTATEAGNQSVDLRWITSSEQDNAYFAVERSSDNATWKEIGRTQGAGYATQPVSYYYSDENVSDGFFYYRLKQIDRDGNYQYSVTRGVRTRLSNVGFKIYPNPASTEVTIESNSDNLAQLSIVDITGTNMMRYVKRISLDRRSIKVDISRLPAGIYFIRASKENSTFFKY